MTGQLWRHFSWYQPHHELGMHLNVAFSKSIICFFDTLLKSDHVICVKESPHIFVRTLVGHECFVQISLQNLLDLVYLPSPYNVYPVSIHLIVNLLDSMQEYRMCFDMYRQLKRFNGTLKREKVEDRNTLLQEMQRRKESMVHVSQETKDTWPMSEIDLGGMGTHLSLPRIYSDHVMNEVVRKAKEFICGQRNGRLLVIDELY